MPMLRAAFAADMEDLEKQLVRMGDFVESMLASAIKALAEQNEALANEVILRDDLADEMDLTIEQRCMRLLALQQPLGHDLRTIGTALKIIADLERIGDYSVDIARVAKSLVHEPYFKPLVDIPAMAAIASEMLRGAIRSFVNKDLELVRQVCQRDDEVDRAWHSLLRELMASMERDPSLVRQATAFILVARYLERIADHVTNIAERVNYAETGEMTELVRGHRPHLGDGLGGGLPERDSDPPT